MKRLIVTVALLASMVPLFSSSASASPATSCIDSGSGVAQTPYQLPGTPPLVEFDGRAGCNGGTFYQLRVYTSAWYTNCSSGCIDNFINDGLSTCSPGISPCYKSLQESKLIGCHYYHTEADGEVKLTSGGAWQPFIGAYSGFWYGCR